MPTRYTVNAPGVSSENIDGEVIIVNLETGSYYSAVDTGAYIWSRITAGDSPASIAGNLSAAFAADPKAVEATVTGFFVKLESERLIARRDDAAPPQPGEQAAPFVEAAMPASYSDPVLNSYSDMQDMLLLDPVHDVADVGWPVAKRE